MPFGKDIPSYTQISAIQHLLALLGRDLPYKARAHAPAEGELQVVHGYAQVWRQLSSAGAGAFELSLVEDGDGGPQAPETWRLRDTGGNELGADVPKGAAEWARCGDVVGILAPGEQAWWPGVIRSVHAEPGHALHVTLYVLSRAPQAVQLQAHIERGEEAVYSGEAARQFDFNRVRAIIVSDGAAGSQAANMLLAPDGWKEGRVYELASDGADARPARPAACCGGATITCARRSSGRRALPDRARRAGTSPACPSASPPRRRCQAPAGAGSRARRARAASRACPRPRAGWAASRARSAPRAWLAGRPWATSCSHSCGRPRTPM